MDIANVADLIDIEFLLFKKKNAMIVDVVHGGDVSFCGYCCYCKYREYCKH